MVGDEVQTIGGVVGTILEITGTATPSSPAARAVTGTSTGPNRRGSCSCARPSRASWSRWSPWIRRRFDDEVHESVEIEDRDGEAEEA